MNTYKIVWYSYFSDSTNLIEETWQGNTKCHAAMRFHKHIREAAGRHYDFRQRPIIWSVTKV